MGITHFSGLDAVQEFRIGGVQVTATAAEINTVAGSLAGVDYTIGSASGGTITVNCQLVDAAGDALAIQTPFTLYVAGTANLDVVGTGPDGGLAAGTDGQLTQIVEDKIYFAIPEADGDLDVHVVESGTATFRLVAVLPNGKTDVSGDIVFA
jgi:hypothetical protein